MNPENFGSKRGNTQEGSAIFVPEVVGSGARSAEQQRGMNIELMRATLPRELSKQEVEALRSKRAAEKSARVALLEKNATDESARLHELQASLGVPLSTESVQIAHIRTQIAQEHQEVPHTEPELANEVPPASATTEPAGLNTASRGQNKEAANDPVFEQSHTEIDAEPVTQVIEDVARTSSAAATESVPDQPSHLGMKEPEQPTPQAPSIAERAPEAEVSFNADPEPEAVSDQEESAFKDVAGGPEEKREVLERLLPEVTDSLNSLVRTLRTRENEGFEQLTEEGAVSFIANQIQELEDLAQKKTYDEGSFNDSIRHITRAMNTFGTVSNRGMFRDDEHSLSQTYFYLTEAQNSLGAFARGLKERNLLTDETLSALQGLATSVEQAESITERKLRHLRDYLDR